LLKSKKPSRTEKSNFVPAIPIKFPSNVAVAIISAYAEIEVQRTNERHSVLLVHVSLLSSGM
jgi:hypothetical protein